MRDAAAIFATYAQDADVARYVTWRPHESVGTRVPAALRPGPEGGQGLMTEAVRAVVAWTLAQPDVHRVWAVCDVENRASARVLEKAGMEREGVLRCWMPHPNVSATPRDCWCYARIKQTE